MEFKDFQQAVEKQMKSMENRHFFVVDIDKDEIWNTYLNSFQPGTNEIYITKREYDCNCCKSFIRNAGRIVTIDNNYNLISIWDNFDIASKGFIPVAKALSAYVKSRPIENEFFHESKKVGVEKSVKIPPTGPAITFDHFYVEIDRKYVERYPGGKLSDTLSNKEVFKRSLEEITMEAAEIVLDLIEQNSIYRGTEFKQIVKNFIDFKKRYDELAENKKDLFCWKISQKLGSAAKIRNTVIGTLLTDISENVALDAAVKMYESKVAPTNYKRPTALISKSMIENAQKKIEELGILESFYRRYANISDITINDTIFIDRQLKNEVFKTVFDDMVKDAKAKKMKSFDKLDEIHIDDFISSVLPNVSSVEIMPENSHIKNLVSLIAPSNSDSKKIFKWNNNFSWSYNGDTTDSIKERVKAAGGVIDAELCCRLAWYNEDDLDFHMYEPGYKIDYTNRRRLSNSGGVLDVDANGTDGVRKDPCENIYYKRTSSMKNGKFTLAVHQFSQRQRNNFGFEVEIEMKGKKWNFVYDKSVPNNQLIKIAEIVVKNGEITINPLIETTTASKSVWGIETYKFQPVSIIMNSPNHWEGNAIGNKHYFFMVQGCKNEGKARGFYNEFLTSDLDQHRKVIEIMGSKMKVDETPDQLSGFGFSSTQRNSIVAKITGSFTRTLKINF